MKWAQIIVAAPKSLHRGPERADIKVFAEHLNAGCMEGLLTGISRAWNTAWLTARRINRGPAPQGTIMAKSGLNLDMAVLNSPGNLRKHNYSSHYSELETEAQKISED